eukprot:TRINITY_DN27238_c0_g1_i1.p1 TRINITY_DN27238_c0_g1~~TRINITY_DN27238_c0_g1_i1.p1  ORF type:complete len:456 (+),score=59.42 TRINITY_DN27238_c0_g1_i1:82-1368(+)
MVGLAPKTTGSQQDDAMSLDVRREAERLFVEAYSTLDTDVWFIIDADWFQKWAAFVCRGAPLPGPISNLRLVDKRGLKPHPDLVCHADYEGINAAVWTFLQERHRGGPVIARHTLDLYAENVDWRPSPSAPFLGVADSSRSSSVTSTRERTHEDDSSADNAQLTRRRDDSLSYVSSEAVRSPAPEIDCRQREASATTSSCSEEEGNTSSLRHLRGRTILQAIRRPTWTRRSRSKSVRSGTADSSSGNEGEVCVDSTQPAATDFIPLSKGSVKKQPTDGSCLFHSLSKGLGDGVDASLLRLQISKYIIENPDVAVADTTLGDWVRYDSGSCVTAYAARMAGNSWGGAIEMQAFTRLYDISVNVYEPSKDGFKRICCFETDSADKRTINVVYQGKCHYDFLELKAPTSAGAINRTMAMFRLAADGAAGGA